MQLFVGAHLGQLCPGPSLQNKNKRDFFLKIFGKKASKRLEWICNSHNFIKTYFTKKKKKKKKACSRQPRKAQSGWNDYVIPTTLSNMYLTKKKLQKGPDRGSSECAQVLLYVIRSWYQKVTHRVLDTSSG